MGIRKFQITPGAFCSMALIVLFFSYKDICFILLAVLIHESGHLISIKIFDGTIRRITISAGGIEISYYRENISYIKEIIIAAAGPAASIIAAIVFSALHKTLLSGINLLFGVANLLPVSPLDGGKILYNLIMCFFTFDVADKIGEVIDIVVCICIFLLGVCILLITKGNISIIICALLLVDVCCKYRKKGVKYTRI